MKQEEKELLLIDLSARLPYGLVINTGYKDLKLDRQHQGIGILYPEDCSDEFNERNNASFYITISGCYYGEDIKPYLRPMSSMTKEEKEELLNLLFDKEAKYFYIDEKGVIDGKTSDLMKEGLNYPTFCPVNIELYTDWLNSRHFDYRGLLERGLALETPDGMYNIKKK